MSNLEWRDPKVFGPPYWYVFHSITAAYPTIPTTTDVSLYSSVLLTFGYVLPCMACSQEYARLMEPYGLLLFQVLPRGKIYVFVWGFLVHNEVNARLHKPIPAVASVCQQWGFAVADAERALADVQQNFKGSRNLQRNIMAP